MGVTMAAASPVSWDPEGCGMVTDGAGVQTYPKSYGNHGDLKIV